MWRCCEENQAVRRLTDQLGCLVPLALVADETLTVDSDGVAVGLIEHGQVPAALSVIERLPYALSLQEVSGDDHVVVDVPRILSGMRVEVARLKLCKREVKPFREFPCPLGAQVRWRDHENAVASAAKYQLLHVQPGHDRFPGSRVIREQKTGTWLAQEAVVDRL